MCDGGESESKNHLAVPNSLRPHGLMGFSKPRVLEWASFSHSPGHLSMGKPRSPTLQSGLFTS